MSGQGGTASSDNLAMTSMLRKAFLKRRTHHKSRSWGSSKRKNGFCCKEPSARTLWSQARCTASTTLAEFNPFLFHWFACGLRDRADHHLLDSRPYMTITGGRISLKIAPLSDQSYSYRPHAQGHGSRFINSASGHCHLQETGGICSGSLQQDSIGLLTPVRYQLRII